MRGARRGLSRNLFVLIMVVVLVGAAAYTADYLSSRQAASPCETLGGAARATTSVANETTIGAITEYNIRGPALEPNAITAAPDGSVWFGEESVPGVGHLFANGTVESYAWPSSTYREYHPDCQYKSGIWGVAVWDGMVWATDGDWNGIVGVNPSTGADTVVNLTGRAADPYTLAVGPDGNLWFTTLSTPAEIGLVTKGLAVDLYRPTVMSSAEVTQIQFVNSTLAYYVAIEPSEYTGAVFSFDPSSITPSFSPTQVGPGFSLVSPNSLAVSGSDLWVTEHGAANLAEFNGTNGKWVVFPTSTENYTALDGTLPYFVTAAGPLVWFNEHYGSKIAIINETAATLTEYSEANPPIDNGSLIPNDLTIALTPQGLWFTSFSENYIGFASASYIPSFTVSLSGPRQLELADGEGATVGLAVALHGGTSGPLRTEASDSENSTSFPSGIRIAMARTGIGPSGPMYQARIEVGGDVPPGDYTVALTVTDGLLYQTAYVFLTVP